MNEPEKKDESFEIISDKEKMWRTDLEEAEKNLMISEKNVLINKEIIFIANAEIRKEADKNAN